MKQTPTPIELDKIFDQMMIINHIYQVQTFCWSRVLRLLFYRQYTPKSLKGMESLLTSKSETSNV